jgi:uncharacterized protein YndB with AHSA1/START domain
MIFDTDWYRAKEKSMTVEFEVSAEFSVPRARIYQAWLDSDGHSKMTGSLAQVSDEPGGSFDAWDGYIQGTNLELQPDQRILQSWRTLEFESTDEDSRLEIILTEIPTGTRVTIRHSNLPEHGMQYQQGWVDSYYTPMHEYFKS